MAQLNDFSKIIHNGNEIGKVLHLGTTIWQKEPDVYLAQDSDFVNVMGHWIYKGAELEVEIPTHINGELVTSTTGMFSGGSPFEATPVTKVVLNHSNVVDMTAMFYGSKATTLDLSSLDTSNVTSMDFMFQDSSATIGYARTQADANKFNASSYKPTELTFVIKPVYLAQDSDFVNVGGYWVYRGSELKVEIPTHINGELVTSTQYMFSGYQNYQATPVTKVVLNHSNVADMSKMFNRADATILDLSSFNTSNVTNMSEMFSYSKATTLDVSNFDTTNVTNMYSMFQNSQATSLDLSSFNTSNVTNMGYMFNTSSATTLDLSSFDTSNVTDMNYMFSSSSATTGYARTQADADRFNASSNKPSELNFVIKPVYLAQDSDFVNVGGYWVYRGLELKVEIPTHINGELVTSTQYMFSGDSPYSATTVTKVILNHSNVTNMSEMFSYSKATTLDVSNFDTSNVTDMSNMFKESIATTLDLSNFDTSNVTDMRNIFSFSRATTLDLSSFDTSNVTHMGWMFYFSNVTTLDLSNFDTSNVTNMSSMFASSTATTLDLSSFDTSNVTDMRSMFSYSTATTLDLSSFNTSKVTDMYGMFSNARATTGYARTQADADRFNTSSDKPTGLNFVVKPVYLAQDSDFVKVNNNWIYRGAALEVEIPTHINGELVTSTQNMFNGMSDYQATPVTKVVLNHPNVTNMSYMFYYSRATTLDLSSFDTSKVTSMSSMFYSSNATTLDLSSFDTSNVTIMRDMFRNSSAATLDLSSFNTSNVTDMVYMFRNSNATTGYARTQADADKFNASSNKPRGLNFVVK